MYLFSTWQTVFLGYFVVQKSMRLKAILRPVEIISWTFLFLFAFFLPCFYRTFCLRWQSPKTEIYLWNWLPSHRKWFWRWKLFWQRGGPSGVWHNIRSEFRVLWRCGGRSAKHPNRHWYVLDLSSLIDSLVFDFSNQWRNCKNTHRHNERLALSFVFPWQQFIISDKQSKRISKAAV